MERNNARGCVVCHVTATFQTLRGATCHEVTYPVRLKRRGAGGGGWGGGREEKCEKVKKKKKRPKGKDKCLKSKKIKRRR